jgi:hypothetical protein
MMKDVQTRRDFLKRCTAAGGFCCAFLCTGRRVSAQDSTRTQKGGAARPIDLKKLMYCGIRCDGQCELYRATVNNDVELKKKVYVNWKWKEKFGFEFDPGQVFCYTCKPGEQPLKIGIDRCGMRKCAMANGMESCVQCKSLQSCGDDFWKKWPEVRGNALQLQKQYIAESKKGLRKAKKTATG